MDMSTITIMATMLPTEILIDKLETAIHDYKLGIDNDAKDKLVVALHIILLNIINDGNIDKAIEMSKHINQMEKREKLFETPKN